MTDVFHLLNQQTYKTFIKKKIEQINFITRHLQFILKFYCNECLVMFFKRKNLV